MQVIGFSSGATGKVGNVDRMVQAGLQRIYSFRHRDGGWGWWQNDESSLFHTAYVLQALRAARDAGIKVDAGVYEGGLDFLQGAICARREKRKAEQKLGTMESQAYVAYVLSLEGRLNDEQLVQLRDILVAMQPPA